MFQKALLVCALVIFATGVLITSILRTISPSYAFSQVSNPSPTPLKEVPIDYYLSYPGVLPDSVFWPAKAARDKAWLFLTTDPLKKSELLLLLADKRLGAANQLLEGGKPELAVTSATKAEKYLEESLKYEEKARNKGEEVGQLLDRLALSSLKHREILEGMYQKISEDARPIVSQTIDYPKKVYEDLKGIFNYQNRPLPKSPFEN